MAAYCEAMHLEFIPRALNWAPGERPEWQRSARWHVDAAASTGFQQRGQRRSRAETTSELARFAAHHEPFYEQLHAQRLHVTP